MAKRASKKALRRPILGALALALLSGQALASGCAAGFAPVSQIDGLRVLAVQADAPYAIPGEQVKMTLTYADSRAGAPAPTVLWIAGCFDPPGDVYYACYEQLASLFAGLGDPAALIESGLVGFGPTFTFTMPEDIVSRRPPPGAGAPYFGVAYLFFLACTGEIKVVPPEGTGEASSFPVGCFDKKGNRLGAEAFVPGFTQVYAFDDGRSNENPTIDAMTLDGVPITGGADTAPKVEACPAPEDSRLGPAGCGKIDPTKECTTYEISITVPEGVGEVDPSGTQPDGKPLLETVWVDYFAERGNLKGEARLVNDSVEGLRPDLGVEWIPPIEPGPARIWAVIHDSRGGQSVVERFLNVE